MTTMTEIPPSASTSESTADTLVQRARALAPTLTEHAVRHDADGTFVTESHAALREAGLLRAAVPTELGGDGATIADLAALQRELAHHCGSTALASSMHQHVVAFTAWRYRRGLPGAEATLRRVAEEGIVLVSTGGGDYTQPRGEAVKVDGGYRVSGTKRFASQSEVGTVMSTMFTYDDPERGRRVLNMAVPIAAEGITVADNWNTLGMRGTASNDLQVTDVFVPEDKVLADRPYGVIDAPLQVISSVAFPIVSAVYLGVAESAYQASLAFAGHRGEDPLVQRQVGLMANRLQVAGWALEGALRAVGDDPAPSLETVAAVMTAKREIALAGVEVCDLAMEVAGGPAFFKGSPIERAYRDIRAAKFHPLSPEDTLVHAGRLALGLPADTV
ncbi:alkylation response protein AidB-like acyl-CoA dehydrogenase [Marmoricola sp. OAE513]|uniref:acyl-CoA dehydrogenase family protein n=1 Tax=Marmoricola sp. OAE513 TaxID=2817894 RepID=UPI001AE68706